MSQTYQPASSQPNTYPTYQGPQSYQPPPPTSPYQQPPYQQPPYQQSPYQQPPQPHYQQPTYQQPFQPPYQSQQSYQPQQQHQQSPLPYQPSLQKEGYQPANIPPQPLNHDAIEVQPFTGPIPQPLLGQLPPPSKFVCYVIPFPPLRVAISPDKFMPCFMVYTQPAPPTPEPVPGEKEGRLAKSKRKWEKSLANAKAHSGLKSKAILALDKSMAATKNSRVEFLTRCPKEITEFELNYPPTMDPAIIQQTFMKMLEMTRKGAQKNMAISTLLLPVTFVVDLFCIFWPLPGPFFPVDAVWAFANYQALNSSTSIKKQTESGSCTITYKASPALVGVQRQLEYHCLGRDTKANIFHPCTGFEKRFDSYQLAQAVGFGSSDQTAVLDPTTGQLTAAHGGWTFQDISDDLNIQLKKSAKEYYRFADKHHVKTSSNPAI